VLPDAAFRLEDPAVEEGKICIQGVLVEQHHEVQASNASMHGGESPKAEGIGTNHAGGQRFDGAQGQENGTPSHGDRQREQRIYETLHPAVVYSG
jgi:hypothetical protein